MAPGEFMEELLVQGVALVAASRRHEDVAADVLMDRLAVRIAAAESNVDVPVKLDRHLITMTCTVHAVHTVKSEVLIQHL